MEFIECLLRGEEKWLRKIDPHASGKNGDDLVEILDIEIEVERLYILLLEAL